MLHFTLLYFYPNILSLFSLSGLDVGSISWCPDRQPAAPLPLFVLMTIPSVKPPTDAPGGQTPKPPVPKKQLPGSSGCAPLWTGKKCKCCKANTDNKFTDIINELITCCGCRKTYHAVCRNPSGGSTNKSVCSKSFLSMYGPLSAHYGDNAQRFGTFQFFCPGCIPKSPAPKTTQNAKVQAKTTTISSESQTFLSGNVLEGTAHDTTDREIDVDGSMSDSEVQSLLGDTPLSGVQVMFKKQEKILRKIESLVQSSTNLETSIENQFSSLKNDLLQGITRPNFPAPAVSVAGPAISAEGPPEVEIQPQPQARRCNPYRKLHENVLPEELKKSTMDFLDTLEGFKTLSSPVIKASRDVLYFGDFDYRYGNVEHKAKEIPQELSTIMKKIEELQPNSISNSCLITRYKSGKNGIPHHRDQEPFLAPWADILTLSLGCERSMSFIGPNGESSSVQLLDNSLMVFSRASQETWTHGITPDTSPTVRYSITFRQLAPYYLNSTAVIGDSNTQHLKFGTGPKTFGKWLPGIRIKAGKIADIPDPTGLYPYRNVVFHTGINDIRGNQQPPDIRGLVSTLLKKAKAYLALYPKLRVHISLLLPTKDHNLNAHVNQFNGLISSLAQNEKNIYVITHNNLAFSDGTMRHEFGRMNRHDGSPQLQDTVHLGHTGIIHFSQNVKNAIIKSRHVSQTQPRDNGRVRLPDSSKSQYPYFTPNPEYKPTYTHPQQIPNQWLHNAGTHPSRNVPNQWLQNSNMIVSQSNDSNGNIGNFGLNIPTNYIQFNNDGFQGY